MVASRHHIVTKLNSGGCMSCRDIIVFMIGGGNYAEFQNLQVGSNTPLTNRKLTIIL